MVITLTHLSPVTKSTEKVKNVSTELFFLFLCCTLLLYVSYSIILFKQENQGAQMVLKEYRLSVIAGSIALPTKIKGTRSNPSICSN